jgi:hypothetical protein
MAVAVDEIGSVTRERAVLLGLTWVLERLCLGSSTGVQGFVHLVLKA